MDSNKPFYLDEPPKRLFLDTSLLQVTIKLNCFSEEEPNFSSLDPKEIKRIKNIPNIESNLKALQNIYLISLRNSFEYVVSENSMIEVMDKKDSEFFNWGMEWLDYWVMAVSQYEEDEFCTGKGQKLLKKLEQQKLGFLSNKDKKLILDAVLYECEIFLTMEERLSKNSDSVYKLLDLKILRPFEYWEHMKPWAALYY